MFPFDLLPPSYDHIELTDDQKVLAIRHAKAYKARRANLPAIMVELTETEISEALRLARRDEQGRLYEIEYTKKLSAPKQYPQYTADQLAKMVIAMANEHLTKLKGKPTEYQFTKENRNIIWKLAQYFTADTRFESNEFSLNKGIALVGPVGCGSSYLTTIILLVSE